MSGILWNGFFLVVALGLLVTVHEFGHFWVARRCGVKVLCFSIGFGTPLWRRIGRDGTEYQIAAIPLGGYVKMLDEREAPVDAAELQFAFNRQPVVSRIAIVAAGPLCNFLFAILAYSLMYMVGITTLKPILGDIDPASIAGRAGLRAGEQIQRMDGREIQSWEDVTFAAVARVGETTPLVLETRVKGTDGTRRYELDISAWRLNGKEPDVLGSLGLKPVEPKIPAVLAEVAENEPAGKAGLKIGDKVLSVDGKPVADWPELVRQITASPERKLRLTVERAGQKQHLDVTPRAATGEDGKPIGLLGVRPVVPAGLSDLQHRVQFGPLDAVWRGAGKTWEVSVLSLKMLGKLVTGSVPVDSISGPISIAQGAGASARIGLEYFLSFLALISINLGLINLLPIPVLDGGHLMYYLIESVRGRPLSERMQEWGLRLGMSLVLGLMLVAVYNDLARL
ncbi:MAG: sigma E protease regulator RseP [Gammaproteobacteria bacterium]|nr:sigma E protease regulator RseP [Gammaproteobacteria bacterium]